MKIIQQKVFLQYPSLGEPGIHGRPTTAGEAEKFVDLDYNSGGYPYDTSIDNAHDFKTVEAAEKYRGHFDKLNVRIVDITYEF